MAHLSQSYPSQSRASQTGTPPMQAPRRHRTYWFWRIIAWLMGGLVVVFAAYFLGIWPWISRWGATNNEVEQTLPGDEFIPDPAFVTTKAVTVNAPPEAIWPWLMQLGVDRGGMYSYLWVENWLLRLHVENSDEIQSEWQNLQEGDFIRFTPQEFALNPGPGLYVMRIEPQRALAGCFGMEQSSPDCSMSSTWQFVLEPQVDGTTRLILRSRSANTGSQMAVAGAKFANVFQFYMERKMLLGLQQRAEMLATQSSFSAK